MSTCKRMWTDRQIRSMASDTAKTLIEAGQTENAKPIYCHPITIRGNTEGDEVRLSMLIFTNTATPFTKSSFITYLDDLFTKVGSTTRLLTSGGFINETKAVMGSYLGKSAATTYYCVGMNVDGSPVSRNFAPEEFSAWITSVDDGVNKIN